MLLVESRQFPPLWSFGVTFPTGSRPILPISLSAIVLPNAATHPLTRAANRRLDMSRTLELQLFQGIVAGEMLNKLNRLTPHQISPLSPNSNQLSQSWELKYVHLLINRNRMLAAAVHRFAKDDEA